MKTKYSAYTVFAALVLLQLGVSCSENYDIYPDEYAKVMMFKESGVKNITVYSPHAVSSIPISVMKGGWDSKSVSDAKVRVMTEAEFNQWLMESGAGYSYLPNNCYSFTTDGGTLEQTVSFVEDEGYKFVTLNVFPPEVGEFMDNYEDVSRTPVIPLVLESTDGLIDPNNGDMFIIPEYKEPEVGFLNGGVCILEDGQNSYTLNIGLPFESEWDITCKVEVDPSVLEDYNKNQATSFGLMPEDAYSGIGTVELAKGEQSVAMDVKIDLSKAGFRNVVPLRITTLSLDGFEIGDATALVGIDNASQFKINLTEDMIVAPDCYGSDGKGIPGLCDGDPSTHFHAKYYSRELDSFGSYLEITLKEEVSELGFDFYTRSSYGNGYVKRVQLYAWNGSEWVMFSDCDAYGKIFHERGQMGSLGSFHCPFKFNKFRFCVIEGDGGSLIGNTSAFWSCGEIILYAG